MRAAFVPGGKTPAVGALFRNLPLADRLRRISREGAKAFYEGEIAEKLVRKLRAATSESELACQASVRVF